MWISEISAAGSQTRDLVDGWDSAGILGLVSVKETCSVIAARQCALNFLRFLDFLLGISAQLIQRLCQDD
jgi:hypothetical protein